MIKLFEWLYGANSFIPIDFWPVVEENVVAQVVVLFQCTFWETIDFIIDPYH